MGRAEGWAEGTPAAAVILDHLKWTSSVSVSEPACVVAYRELHWQQKCTNVLCFLNACRMSVLRGSLAKGSCNCRVANTYASGSAVALSVRASRCTRPNVTTSCSDLVLTLQEQRRGVNVVLLRFDNSSVRARSSRNNNHIPHR